MCVASALACLSGCMSRYLMMGAVQSSASPRAFIARLRCAAFWQLCLCTLESLPMDDVQNSRPLCSRAQWSLHRIALADLSPQILFALPCEECVFLCSVI